MKKVCFLVLSSVLLFSCASLKRVSGKTYMCNKSSIMGSCKELIKQSCPNGHKVESTDSKFQFGAGMRDEIYFSCKES